MDLTQASNTDRVALMIVVLLVPLFYLLCWVTWQIRNDLKTLDGQCQQVAPRESIRKQIRWIFSLGNGRGNTSQLQVEGILVKTEYSSLQYRKTDRKKYGQ